MKILVVFYSRTGITRKVARAVGAQCRADIEEIRDARPRKGLLRGWWRSIREVGRGRETQILPTAKRAENYDLIVLGTPVWASSMSSPLRTWLNRHRSELKRVAVFVTQGGRGGDKAIAQLATLFDLAPAAELIVNAKDVTSGAYKKRMEEFAARLLASQPAEANPAPSHEAAV
jgi:flavodoxin